jgi:hypothetical protein
MRSRTESKRFGGRVQRPLLSLSSFILAIMVGVISSFLFSAAYDMTRPVMSGQQRPAVSGVWRGYWQKVPAVTVKLEEQDGHLSGTVSFNRIFNTYDGPRSEEAAREIPIVNPRLEGKRLLFELQAPEDFYPTLVVEMEMSFENEGEVGLRCTRRNSIDVPVDKEPPIRMRLERSF